MAAEVTAELIPIESESESDDDLLEVMLAKRGCCFWMPCIGSDRSSSVRSNLWERITGTDKDDLQGRHWWSKGVDAFKKVKEWSELVAGPKWKNFIRRCSKNKPKPGKFQYDPLSYALNFDDGHGHNGNLEDEDRVFRAFSLRYASIPISAKSSMEMGKDVPTFT